MLDLGFVRGNLEKVEEKLRARGADPAALLGDFRTLDNKRRSAITESEQLTAEINVVSKRIGELNQAHKMATEPREFAKLPDFKKIKISVEHWTTVADLTQIVRENKQKKSELDQDAAVCDEQMRLSLASVPNLTRDEVPTGTSETDNVIVKTWGEKPAFNFAPKPHWELGESLGILDLERAAKLSGARFAVYMGAGARLERALISFMLDTHTARNGYTEVLPPFMVNGDSMYGTGQLPKFEEDLFKVPTSRFDFNWHHMPIVGETVCTSRGHGTFRIKSFDDKFVELEHAAVPSSKFEVLRSEVLYQTNYYLIPTAEVPVTNLYRDEILDETKLPICLTAYTPCFRAEAGAAGKDTRGIIRQHQFQKVELVKFTRPEDSDAEHEKLTRNAEEILEALKLPYRRMLLCTGDTGFSAAKTFDLEVWLPGQQLYREISSCSNFEGFQARRANIRYKAAGSKGKNEFVHTLNGSGLAVGRTWLAILENYQQADGSVVVPDALKPYMGGLEVIRK